MAVTDNRWTWAALTGEQLQLVQHAEQTLGDHVNYLLVFRAPEAGSDGYSVTPTPPRLAQLSALSDSQLECLQGLERQLHAVVIAYEAR